MRLWLPFCSGTVVSRFFNAVLVVAIYLTLGIKAAPTTGNFVILISFDGFRYDYLEKYKGSVPTLRSIAENGTRPEYLQNVFPSVTFPNHYTLVTGLYPESHGIVSNDMYDPIFNASFTMMTNESRWWNSAEPIWVTNEIQGHKSGNCFWPGYDVKIKDHILSLRPNNSYGKPFAESKNLMPWKERVDLVVSWLSAPNPPSFVTLYYEEPDEVGHAHGTDTLQLAEYLRRLDKIALYLMESLKNLEIFDRINFIFTSDHGMINFNGSYSVDIDKYVDPNSFTLWAGGHTGFLATNSSSSTLEGLYHSFKTAEQETNGLIRVYKKEDIPLKFHYSHNRRIADIIGIMSPGYVLKTSKFKNQSKNLYNSTHGAHGYSPFVPSMHPYLIAYGPAFKQGYRPGPIQMVDLYPLMCHILDIKPVENNGSLSRIQHILRQSNGWIQTHLKESVAIGVGSFILVLSCIIATCVLWKRFKKRRAQHSVQFRNFKDEWNKPLIDTVEEDEVVIF